MSLLTSYSTELKLEMMRKSEDLTVELHEQLPLVDFSKQYCRVRLSKDTMGIHVIQFSLPLTESRPYYCIEIRQLSKSSFNFFDEHNFLRTLRYVYLKLNCDRKSIFVRWIHVIITQNITESMHMKIDAHLKWIHSTKCG